MNNTYTLYMIDECGTDVIIDRYTLNLLTDQDEIEVWKAMKVEKAHADFPEATGFYWEDSASLYWAVAEAINEEGRFVDPDDEDDLIEGAYSNAPCDNYGYCPYGEQCDLHCNQQ